MNRSEFMFTLAQLLVDLPFEERSEALKFYNSYFDDAGPENEQHIIEELKSPQAVAQSIRDGLESGGMQDQHETGYTGNQTNTGYTGNQTNTGYTGNQTNTEYTGNQTYTGYTGNQTYTGYSDNEHDVSSKMYSESRKNKMSNGKIIALVIIVICALPVLLGVGGGIVGILFGLIGALIGVLAGIFSGAVGGIFGGIGGIIAGFVRCFSAPAEGLAAIGAGFFSLGGGILLMMLLVWLCSFVLPRFIRWIKNAWKRIFGRRKSA